MVPCTVRAPEQALGIRSISSGGGLEVQACLALAAAATAVVH